MNLKLIGGIAFAFAVLGFTGVWFSLQEPPPPHFVPKPPVVSRGCCSAGVCEREHHHESPISDSDWHEEIVPLENAPLDQQWHYVKDAGGYSWGKEQVTI